MKKFITLALALVLALSLAVPAMAFTSDEYTSSSKTDAPYELSARLVDVGSEDDFSGLMVFSVPSSDRGYITGEVVCVIFSMYVPKDNDPYAKHDFRSLKFESEGVNLRVADNMASDGSLLLTHSTSLDGKTALYAGATSALKSDEIAFTLATGLLLNSSSNKTYSWAVYGKVTSDEALMSMTLSRESSFKKVAADTSTNATNVGKLLANDSAKTGTPAYNYLNIDKYAIIHDTGACRYFVIEGEVTVATGDLKDGYLPLFIITYNNDTNYKTTGLYLFDRNTGAPGAATSDPITDASNTVYRVFSGYMFQEYKYTNNTLTSVGGSTLYSSTSDSGTDLNTYRRLLGRLEDTFEDVFELDFSNIGNVMKEKFFTNMNTSDDLYEEIVIEPWVASVTVPPEIEVDPPKTGDAVSMLGFAMIAIAALAVVAVKKVRA